MDEFVLKVEATAQRGWHLELLRADSSIVFQRNKESAFLLSGVIDFSPIGDASTVEGLQKILSRFLSVDEVLKWASECDGQFCLIAVIAGQLVAIRDAFGVHGLCCHAASDYFLFSSSPGALVRQFPVLRGLNSRYVFAMVCTHYRYLDSYEKETAYSQIMQVPGGSFLKAEGAKKFEIGRYYDVSLRPEYTSMSQDELVDQYLGLLERQIKRRLSRAGKTIYSVSSGIDSASVACTAAKLGLDVDLYSCSYGTEMEYDESVEVQSLAKFLGKPLQLLEVGVHDLFPVWNTLTEKSLYPLASVTFVAHGFACGVLQDKYQNVVSGLGGDEIHSGEFEHFIPYFADLHRHSHHEVLNMEIAGWAHHHFHPEFPKNRDVVERALREYMSPPPKWQVFADPERFSKYGLCASDGLKQEIGEFIPPVSNRFDSYLLNKIHQELWHETIPCCLRSDFLNVSGYNMRTAFPYLNQDLFSFGFSLPLLYRYNGGVSKAFARHAMKGILPDASVLQVKKVGWNAPLDQWLRQLHSEVEARICDSRLQQYVNQDVCMGLWREHLSGQKNHMMLLFPLLNLQILIDHLDRAALVS